MSMGLNRYFFRISLLAATLLSAVSFVIVPRFPNTPDNVAYISMAKGDYGSVPAPFRYRLIAPTLAGILPMQPASALRAVTVASQFFVYVLALRNAHSWELGCRRLC